MRVCIPTPNNSKFTRPILSEVARLWPRAQARSRGAIQAFKVAAARHVEVGPFVVVAGKGQDATADQRGHTCAVVVRRVWIEVGGFGLVHPGSRARRRCRRRPRRSRRLHRIPGKTQRVGAHGQAPQRGFRGKVARGLVHASHAAVKLTGPMPRSSLPPNRSCMPKGGCSHPQNSFHRPRWRQG